MIKQRLIGRKVVSSSQLIHFLGWQRTDLWQSDQRLLPTKHAVTIRISIGAACVGGIGRSDARKRRGGEQNNLLVSSMDYGFFIDGDDG